MAPFLMNVVSDCDLWLFAGSNGPFTAGRRNPDLALFPYQTADKILEHADTSGARTILLVARDGRTSLWEPWGDGERVYAVTRNLYKSVLGTASCSRRSTTTWGCGSARPSRPATPSASCAMWSSRTCTGDARRHPLPRRLASRDPAGRVPGGLRAPQLPRRGLHAPRTCAGDAAGDLHPQRGHLGPSGASNRSAPRAPGRSATPTRSSC